MATGADSVEGGASGAGRATLPSLVSPLTERQRERRRIVALCLPFLALLLFSGVVPLTEMARISVSEKRLVTEGFTPEYYRRLVTDPYYRTIAVNTLWFALATTVASIAVAVPVAHALEKYDLPAKSAILTVLSFPNSLPGIVAAFMIIVLFGNTGLITNVLAAFSGRSPIDLATATSVVGLFFAYLYSMIPRALLLLRGTYAEVNTDAEEAARSLGASPLATFRYVTLPQIKPGLVGAFVLVFRTALAIFGTILILKSLLVWTLQIDREIAQGFNIAQASAMATVWFAFVLAFTFLTLRYTSAEVSI
ncbi:putative spermidine/putrescine transport system permease protein [Halomicrobium zhouii]|uniref:Putative spermidine/putrescine transport system permease protein n=1 Tax=Halomicrobium zhouii TaxID=767519 RepID=A0A1I6MBC0_9EURY|nr:ABC transporter permease subunit [Halomicrobium zhouii]SFS12961.1 putative spermidine/putrescine transport system permease protein [Halomicrobium zhouii]